MPSVRSIARSIRGIRQGTNASAQFHDLNELYFPIDVITLNNENILKFDSGAEDPNRFLIFSTNHLISLVNDESQLHCDGTFSVCPQIFSQLYVFGTMIRGTLIPVAYMLLPGKSMAIYENSFEALKNLFGGICPASFMLDLEIGAINIIKQKWPNSDIVTCFFHFCQVIYSCLCYSIFFYKAVYRKVSEQGFKINYDSDLEFCRSIKKLYALAFLPAEKIHSVFIVLAEEIEQNHPDLRTFLAYFEQTYVGFFNRAQTQFHEPLFAKQHWSLYNTIINGRARTNNPMEGWNSHFKTLTNCAHPHLFKLIETIKTDMGYNTAKSIQLSTGQSPVPQRSTYKNLTQRIENVVFEIVEMELPTTNNLIEIVKRLSLII